jgi:hypothetical protein
MTPVPDPWSVAAKYGLWPGIATGLFALIVIVFWRVYGRECKKNDALMESLSNLTGDMKVLIALVTKGAK